ncbi:MAG: peptidoglycan DD-metalloendopeptidase family protein [Bacteroidetes bacterium]|nr:peptidoglycan DD-metalloendopeptidase family protein [Bacteroidota bacterium]
MILFKYKKNKLSLLFALLFSFVLIPSLYAQTGSKNSKKDLENKKKKINDEINEINSMLSETKANKKSSIGALVNINMKLEKRQDLINMINAEIHELNRDIKQSEKQAEQLKSNLEKLKGDYARMIIFAQRNQDAYSKIMFVFAADNFNQAYSRLKYMQQYSEFRKKQAVEIITTQTGLIAKLKELKDQRHEKNVLLGNEEVEKENLSSEKQEQEQVLTELQKKEKELKTELDKKKQDAVELQLAIKRLIEAEIKRKMEEARKAEEAALAAKKAKEEKEAKENKTKLPKDKSTKEKVAVADLKPVKEKKENLFMPALTEETEALSADFSNNRGKLPWPVGKGVICETYGEHEHPAIKGFMMFNNGVEICATKGTQARAVFDGEVTGIAVSPTGGKLVIIRHGEYLSVYSNLTDVTVKTGQKVTVKQIIGTVASDEEEGKTSMNLQIWKGQKTMDPSGWLYNAR